MAFDRNDFHDDELDLDELRRLAGEETEPELEPDEMDQLKKLIEEPSAESMAVDEPTQQIPAEEDFDFTRLTQPTYRQTAETKKEEAASGGEPGKNRERRTKKNRAEKPKPEKPARKSRLPQYEDDEDYEEESDGKTIRVVRRQRTGCLGALVFFAFVVSVSVLLAVVGWIAAQDVLALGKEDLTAVVEISQEDDVRDVAEKLKDAGIIRYPWLFRLFGVFADADEKISAGSFELNTTMDYRAIISAMGSSSGTRLTVTVTIPEGFTVEQILDRLAENGVAELEDLQETAANYDYEYSFLEEIPLGEVNRLEGYLFPDTYEFYVGESTVTALNKLLSNFNNKFDEDMRERAEEMGYSIHDIVTIASLIEREAAADSERATIASVIYNRLNSADFPYLQIDATIQYVLPEGEIVTQDDYYNVDSPYNTYLYEGLPPGPIANPGRASMIAALHPEETGYYFYALGEDGLHKFSYTIEEHEAFVESMRDSEGAA